MVSSKIVVIKRVNISTFRSMSRAFRTSFQLCSLKRIVKAAMFLGCIALTFREIGFTLA